MPASFHRKNRGITYLCDKFEYDNSKRRLLVNVPVVNPSASNGQASDDDEARFGIADGGHTYEVIRRTVDRINELKEIENWSEPFVRVHFLAGEMEVMGELRGDCRGSKHYLIILTGIHTRRISKQV